MLYFEVNVFLRTSSLPRCFHEATIRDSHESHKPIGELVSWLCCCCSAIVSVCVGRMLDRDYRPNLCRNHLQLHRERFGGNRQPKRRSERHNLLRYLLCDSRRTPCSDCLLVTRVKIQRCLSCIETNVTVPLRHIFRQSN